MGSLRNASSYYVVVNFTSVRLGCDDQLFGKTPD